MTEKAEKFKWNDTKAYGMITVLSVMTFCALLWILTGKGPFDANVYNSYALQADSWRQGRLHLAENYSWLELAVYEGRYYVSFPPFPSYLLFPLTFLFGSQTPDNVILCLVITVTVIFLCICVDNMVSANMSAMKLTNSIPVIFSKSANSSETYPKHFFASSGSFARS